ncbi:MAG: hypothetical protein WDM96_17865 [Lacunisphaera sp.]
MPSRPPLDLRVPIASSVDIVTARQTGRQLGLELGLDEADVTLLAAAISEVARNIIDHAHRGELLFNIVANGMSRGLQVIARDAGPRHRGYQAGHAIRLLHRRRPRRRPPPGAKWLMDEFEIDSTVGHGTRVTMAQMVQILQHRPARRPPSELPAARPPSCTPSR